MDLVILIVILTVVVIAFKKFDNFVYCAIFIDILLRILTQIKIILHINELTRFMNQYIPESIPFIFRKYSSGIFFDILLFGYIVLYIIFEVNLFKIFVNKK